MAARRGIDPEQHRGLVAQLGSGLQGRRPRHEDG
jgi:hypothetical protein